MRLGLLNQNNVTCVEAPYQAENAPTLHLVNPPTHPAQYIVIHGFILSPVLTFAEYTPTANLRVILHTFLESTARANPFSVLKGRSHEIFQQSASLPCSH